MADQNYEIQSESPVVDDLLFWSVVGHESLSRPSVYELTVLSRKQAIDAKDILGKSFDVVIHFMDQDQNEHQRHCQGFAVRFVRMSQSGRYYEYRITLRSWFWLLTRRVNARIFQDAKAVEVLNQVFDDSSISGHKKTEDRLTGQHDPRTYCVQYMESDYHFLSRLMENEGIYYWFDAHDNPGTMLLADNSSSAHDALPATQALRWSNAGTSEARYNEITQWVGARRLDSGKYASRDSDFKAIRKKLGADIDTSDEHDLADFEVFEFAGGYFDAAAGENLARTRGDELIALRDRYWAVTRWPDVAVGKRFKLENHDTNEGEYLIGGCTFSVTHPGYEGVGAATGSRSGVEGLRRLLADDAVDANTADALEDMARNIPAFASGGAGQSAFVLTALPAELPFRPPRLTPRKLMPGPQSAIVVGASGKEIEADKYGRVKVHFHWDRYDQSNEKSSCWVRVSQPWAGKGWGGYFTPRIGQEVIVDFLNGDPDRPIIVGRVYNDEQTIPYASPTESGFKTRSTPGGDSTNYNEIKFEDKKGSEVLSIHAERNMSTSVENDDSTTVDHDQSLTVRNNRTALVKGNETTAVEKNQTNSVLLNQSNTVNVSQTTIVGAAQTNIVGAAQLTQVGAAQTVVVGGAQSTTVGGAQTVAVGGAQSITAGGGQTTTVSGDMSVDASGEMKIHAASRKDLANGAFAIMANEIKVVSNTNLAMMAVGNIDATSIGSNTTVLGSNSSGYIGINSEANLGMARSTFMGMSIGNSLGMDISNFGGLQIENAVALKLIGVGAAEIACRTLSAEQQGLKSFMPGAGAGAAAGAAVAGVLGAAAGAASAIVDVNATLEQYEKAQKDLSEAAKEAAQNGLPGLAGRLSRLSAVAGRRSQTMNAVAAGAAAGGGIGLGLGGGPLGVAGGAVVGGGVGLASQMSDGETDALSNDKAAPTSAATPPPKTT